MLVCNEDACVLTLTLGTVHTRTHTRTSMHARMTQRTRTHPDAHTTHAHHTHVCTHIHKHTCTHAHAHHAAPEVFGAVEGDAGCSC